MVLSPSYSYPGIPEETSSGGTALLLCLFVVFTECQNVFGEFLSISGAQPDLVLAAAVACGIFRGRDQGFWLGFASGFIQDLASSPGVAMGQLALSKMMIGWLAGCLSTSVRRTFILVPILLIVIATVVNHVILAIFTADLASLQWRMLTSSALVNVIYGIPIYYFVGLFPGRQRS